MRQLSLFHPRTVLLAPALLFVGSLLLLPLCFFKATIGRLSGVLFLGGYVAYIAWLI